MPFIVHEVKFYFIGCFCCFGSVIKVSDVCFYENKNKNIVLILATD